MTNIAPTQSPLGAAVATRMAALKISQRQLAKSAGVPQANISDLLSGKIATPKLDNVQALAAALDTTVGALLGEASSPELAEGSPAGDAAAILVPLDQLYPSPMNPRKRFDDAALQQLAESLVNLGMLQPVTARSAPDGNFEVILGGRRLRAATLNVAAGLWNFNHPIPVALVDADDVQALEMATAENVQRADMHPLEEADAFVELRRRDVSTESIAAAVGKTQRWVQERLRIGENLGAEAREAFLDGTLSLAMARELSRAPAAVQAAAMVKVYETANRGWHLDADAVRSAMANPFPPISAAAFDRSMYTGETIVAEHGDGDEGDPERFVDVAQFKRLQWEAINTIEAKLLKTCGWVDRHEASEWWNPTGYSVDYTRDKPADDAHQGAVIRIDPNTMAVKVFKKLYRAPKSAPAGETKADAPAERDPVEKIGAGRRVLARNVKTRAIQTELSGDFTVALQVACTALLGAYAACRIHITSPGSADRGVIAPTLAGTLKTLAKTLNSDRKTKLVAYSEHDAQLSLVGGSWNDNDHRIFEAVRSLSDADLQVLFAALVAGCSGSFAHSGGSTTGIGDTPMAVTIAEALQVETKAHWRMDADYLAKLTKAELVALARRIELAVDEDYREWARMKTGDLRAAILGYIEANDVRHVPPEMEIQGRMVTEAAIRRQAKEAGRA